MKLTREQLDANWAELMKAFEEGRKRAIWERSPHPLNKEILDKITHQIHRRILLTLPRKTKTIRRFKNVKHNENNLLRFS